MLFYDHAWPATPDTCPCDFDLIDWLAGLPVSRSIAFNRTMLHFGSGLHHCVGLAVAEQQLPIRLVSLTASPVEHAEYVRLAIERPDIMRRYQCVFGDIYAFDPRAFLPPLDIATLFHLCEFTDDRRAAYGGVDDEGVVSRFVEALRPGGRLLFYTGSMRYDRARPIVDAFVARGELVDDGTFRSLRICRVPA